MLMTGKRSPYVWDGTQAPMVAFGAVVQGIGWVRVRDDWEGF